jgi:hypothetical protein
MMGFVTDLAAAVPPVGGGGGGSIEALLSADPMLMTGAERSGHLLDLDRVQARLDRVRFEAVACWDTSLDWAADGASSAVGWMTPRCGVSRNVAAQRVKVARWLRGAPALMADALDEAKLTAPKVAIFATVVCTDRLKEAFVADAPWLVEHAAGLRVEDVARFLRHWATYADPESAADDEDKRQHDRAVYLAETFRGMGDLQGTLTPECLLLARTLLDRIAEELYQDEARGVCPPRSAAQRRHDAFQEAMRRAAAWEPQNNKQAHPSLMFLLDYDTYAETAPPEPDQQAQADDVAAAGADRDEPDDEAEPEPEPVGEVLLVPTPDDLAAHASRLTDDVDAQPGDDETDQDADAGSKGVPRPIGPDDGPAGSGSDAPDDETTDSGRPADRKSGRGRGDPVRVDPGHRLRAATKVSPWNGPHITAETARRLACDADISRIITGPDGEVLDHGRTKRLFTPPQRRAILARYGFRCAFPGCDRPAGWLRIHHLEEWTRDHGPTDLDKGVPLCDHDHHLVHEGGYTLHRAPNGDITAYKPDGTHVDPHPETALWRTGGAGGAPGSGA